MSEDLTFGYVFVLLLPFANVAIMVVLCNRADTIPIFAGGASGSGAQDYNSNVAVVQNLKKRGLFKRMHLIRSY